MATDFMPTPEHITLTTIRQHVEQVLSLSKGQVKPAHESRAAGYDHACRDILTILNMHGRPLDEPVVFTD